MDTIFGLPTHILVIHLPVVGVPLLALLSIASSLKPSWSIRFGRHLVALSLAVLAVTWLALETGEAFNELLDGAAPTKKHQQLAESSMLFVLGLTGAVVGMVFARTKNRRRPAALLSVAVVALAALSTTWIVRTGHEGARITWSGVLPENQP